MIKAQMSTAELSDIRIENVTDPVKPFIYAFHVKVPGYAQRTGKRLFLQPAFFQRGLQSEIRLRLWLKLRRFACTLMMFTLTTLTFSFSNASSTCCTPSLRTY